MNTTWFDRLARDVARGMPRRNAIRLIAGAFVLTVFGIRRRPGTVWGAERALAQDQDCDGIRTLYYPECPHPVPKQNYQSGVNGCGPEGGVFGTGINAVPNSPLGIANFTSACDGHDRGYGTCNRPKKDTDDQFLRDMQSTCISTYGGGGLFGAVAMVQCFKAAQTYHDAVSKLGEAAFKAGQEAACDCCECKGSGGAKCLNPRQYRILKERVVVFCKFLQANPSFQPTGPLQLAGVSAGNFYQYSVGEQNALIPVCTELNALIEQTQ
jgi:hypothetical protein